MLDTSRKRRGGFETLRSVLALIGAGVIFGLAASAVFFWDRLAANLGAPPSDWAVLVRAGALRGIPADPSGTPYEIDTLGRVSLSNSSPLSPLPAEPKRLVPPAS